VYQKSIQFLTAKNVGIFGICFAVLMKHMGNKKLATDENRNDVTNKF
jgi:hypothetical protein